MKVNLEFECASCEDLVRLLTDFTASKVVNIKPAGAAVPEPNEVKIKPDGAAAPEPNEVEIKPAGEAAPEPTITADDLAKAAIPLADSGKLAELQQLLASFNVQALPQLTVQQYDAFAAGLRGLGAQI